jgi:DNA (cytosine-5)-methyltransferase 1
MDIARLNGLKVSRVVDNLMPTPKARDSQAEGYEAGLRRATPQVGTIVKGLVDGDPRVLIPTPTSRDFKDGQSEHERKGIVQTDTVSRAIFNSGQVLLPTTRTSMANGPTQKEIALGNPKTRIETEVMLGETSWGKFEPAIRRWEQTLGRPSPLPTKPDGKDGAHRLSSAFTEWMMGLPTGWVTAVGLTRNEELKACGNGVVPQQAELALRSLLQGVTLPTGGGGK